MYDKLNRFGNQSGGLKIIVYLLKTKGRSLMKDFLLDLRISNAVLARAVEMLKELDIINEENPEGTNARFFTLSSKGKEIAEHIFQINNLLES